MAIHGTITLRNYRCFDWNSPAILEFGDGFTAYVGPNNSGKSAALRAIYELRPVLQSVALAINPSNNFIIGGGAFLPLGTVDPTELAHDGDPTCVQFLISIAESTAAPRSVIKIATKIEMYFNLKSRTAHAESVEVIDKQGKAIQLSLERVRQGRYTGGKSPAILSYQNTTGPADDIDYSLILDFCNELFQSKYYPAFRNAINAGAGDYYDLPIGTALVAKWDEWKAGNVRTQKIAISKVESEIADLLGFTSLQINADQSGKTLDVIIDNRPHKLYEVGAGVAQLIIVLAAALIHSPPYILIDEPELSLHPALQLKFLTTLASYASRGVLYATHAIGLARSTAERLYVVKKRPGRSSLMRPYSEPHVDFAEWLGELSYSIRADLGCEGILLVEGISDLLCFQEFLRKIGKDQQYALIQLRGSSLIRPGIGTELAHLVKIVDAKNIRVFIDSEKLASDDALKPDRVSFVSECAALHIVVHVSERRALENYFEANGILKGVGNRFRPLAPYEKLESAVPAWRKAENWKIARYTDLLDIDTTDLGLFLQSL